jgi:hypothetical protein
MPKAAFLIEYNPDVGNWEENPNYLEQHGVTLIEEIHHKSSTTPTQALINKVKKNLKSINKRSKKVR